jgi:multidrug efflux pump subunit AcrA (membrane-fusion protein)
LQQGFGQAAAQRQQDIANRGALATQQQGLGQFQAGLGQLQQAATGTDISRLGSLGALNQAQAQANLDAQREAARQATFLPQEQLDRFAGQVTGIMGGYPGQTQTTNIPNPTPLQTALGVGSTLAGIYGTVVNKNPFSFLQGN